MSSLRLTRRGVIAAQVAAVAALIGVMWLGSAIGYLLTGVAG